MWGSREAIASDDDFLRAAAVVGPEYPVYRALVDDHPAGTPVAIESTPETNTRAQRFWLAVLPRHPIRADASLVLCATPCRAGDELLARGYEFSLVRRREGQAVGVPNG